MIDRLLGQRIALFLLFAQVFFVRATVVTNFIQDSIGVPVAIVPKIDVLNASSLKSMYSLFTKEGRENALAIVSQRLASAKNRLEKYTEPFARLKLSTEKDLASLEQSLGACEEDSIESKFIKEMIDINVEKLNRLIEKADLHNLIVGTIDQHKEFLSGNININLEGEDTPINRSFYIEDLEVAEAQASSVDAKLNGLKAKRDKLAKQLTSVQNRRLEKKRDMEKLDAELKTLKVDKISAQTFTQGSQFKPKTKEECLVLDLKRELCRLEEDVCELKGKKISSESNLVQDELAVAEIKKRALESKVMTIKQRLFVTNDDLKKITNEIELNKKKAQKTKTKLNSSLFEKRRLKIKEEEKVERLEAKLKDNPLQSLNSSSKVATHLNLLVELISSKKELVLIEGDISKIQFQEELEVVKEYGLLFKLKNAQFYFGSKIDGFVMGDLLNAVNKDLDAISLKIKEFESQLLLDSGLSQVAFEVAEYRSTVTAIEKLSVEQKISNKETRDLVESFEDIARELGLMLSSGVVAGSKGLWDECLEKYRTLQQKYLEIQGRILEAMGQRYIWTRSSRAISLSDLIGAWRSIKSLSYELVYSINAFSAYQALKAMLFQFSFRWLLYLLLIIFIAILAFILMLRGLFAAKSLVEKQNTYVAYSQIQVIFVNLIRFIIERYIVFYSWLFLFVLFQLQHIIGFVLLGRPFEVLFYLATIPISLKFLYSLLTFSGISFDKLNFSNTVEDWSIFEFRNLIKNEILFSLFLYAGAIILPLRSIAILYQTSFPSKLPVVLLASYTLFVEILFFLFFNREAWLSVIIDAKFVSHWIKNLISRYYYSIFFYVLTIAILYNPYVGYFNLAQKLLLWVPISILIVYVLWLTNEIFRGFLLSIFVIEEDDSIIERFENGRMIYGFIVTVSSLAMFFLWFFLLSKIWGMSYTFEQFVFYIKSKWVLSTSTGETLGVIQLFEFIACVLSGFIASSVINRFVITKLFDAFNSELGFQNTVHRLTHYFIICISGIIGLISVGLQNYIPMILGLLILGIGIALKDLLSDVFGGICILLERQFEIGHFVELESEGITGTVQKISFRSTVIRTARNFFIAVPNRIMMSKPVTNWGMMRFAIGAEITIRVNFDQDPKKIVEILYRAIDGVQGIMKIPSPVVRLDGFFESGMSFYARAFFSGKRVREMFNVCSDLRISIITELQKNKIQMPYQHQTIRFVNKDSSQSNNISQEASVSQSENKDSVQEDPFITINLIKPEEKP